MKKEEQIDVWAGQAMIGLCATEGRLVDTILARKAFDIAEAMYAEKLKRVPEPRPFFINENKELFMDELTLKRIEEAHPIWRDRLKRAYIKANNKLGKGSRLRFAYVVRTFAEQDELYAKGRTKKGLKITNAKGGQSIHNYGLACDIVLLYDNDGNGTFEEASWSMIRDYDKDGLADWMEVVNCFKEEGFEWGGDWKSFKDNPHFQAKKPDGSSYRWQELKAKWDKGDTFTEVVNGKTMTYVNL